VAGTAAGLLILMIHLSGLECLGINYLSWTGSILRPRLLRQKYRSQKLNPQDRRTQK